MEITTAAALLMTYTLGVLAGLGHTHTPVAPAILMTLLLALKVELRKFAGGVSMEELRGAVLPGLIGLVIYPVLPNRFIDRRELVNLRQAWVSVVVIASIAFVSYMLLRLYDHAASGYAGEINTLRAPSSAVNPKVRIPTSLLADSRSKPTSMYHSPLQLLALGAPGAPSLPGPHRTVICRGHIGDTINLAGDATFQKTSRKAGALGQR